MAQTPQLSTTTGAPSKSHQPALKPFPAGIVAVLPSDTVDAPLGDLSTYTGWTMSEVNGFRFRTTWSRISGARGQYDWSRIDQLQSLCARYNKFWTINVAAGINTPQWVYNLGAASYALDGGAGTMPVPWDSGFQGLWFEFLQAFAARYDGDVRMRAIIPCGFMPDASMAIGDATDEANMPHTGYPDVDTAYTAASQAIMTMYASLHKTTSFMPTNAPVFSTTTGGQLRTTFLNWLNATYAQRGGSMSTSLQATLTHTGTVRPAKCSGRQSYQPCIIGGSVNIHEYNPDNNAATFPQILADLCQTCLDNGGHYLEVYQPDIQDSRGFDTLTTYGALLRANVPLLQ